ncbi:MAG: 2Fe-2S iron-sulfur cluster-binding protein [Pseudobdellovibrionaceae bacterium]|nr:2Fe-2S iron-sulfur cluster-binding protein [Pseudobdellovibrionaceae bacterium]
MNGIAVRSCLLPATALSGAKIQTIEGFESHPVQKAWIQENVVQCGYCQPGQIMSAIALLNGKPNPTDQEIIDGMQGNLCRCGTYCRIRKAVRTASKNLGARK